MSTSNSRQSYDDCYETMDKALTSRDGVRIGFNDRGEAMYHRTRMNYARTLDRRYNGNDRSMYDLLSFRLRHVDGMHWIYVEKRREPALVEEIQSGEGTEDLDRPLRQTIVTRYRRF